MSLVYLRDLIQTQKGYAFKSKWFIKKGIPIVKVKDFTDNSISTDNIEFISNEVASDFIKYKLHTDDIIIQTVGSWPSNPNSVVGKAVKVPNFLEGALLNQNAVKIISTEGLNNKFLYYVLRDNSFKSYIINTAQGSASQASITLESIKNYKFNLPPLLIQKRIADILSAYDDLIENNLKRIKLLEQAAHNIYKEWFINMRFPGHENTTIDQETGLPEGWKECRISDTCIKISSGGTPSRKKNEFWINPKFKWVTTKELKDNYIVEVKESISQMGLDNSSAKLFPKGTIVMAIYASPTLGRLGILTEESCFNQAAVGFICDTKRINNEFLFYKLLEERDNLNALAIGAAQQNINVGKVKEHKIVLPNIDLINEYRKEILLSFNLRLNLVFQNQKLKSARDILLPRLMNQTIEV